MERIFKPDVSATGELPGEAEERSGPCSPLEEEVTALFVEFRGPLLRYVLSLGLTVQDGEEAIQEVFLALFQHLKSGKPRDNLRGWLFRVGHNQALKVRGRPIQPDDRFAKEQIDLEPNPEEQAAGKQRQRRLAAVICALPESHRACLSLRAEGLRYREISEILGMSLGAVSLALTRSLAKLSRVDVR